MVLGFGSIGQNVCRYLSGYLGMLVRVVDPNPTRVELASIFHEAPEIYA
jgi:phosphoglycerate dehydrogenase-like enzyme